ncbi:uncharacterized protein LOC108675664 [Hyalella azteca]|uniref:Uncharacterized protein LOC108675664 n=1 Tax=Hyalella azteca TaxID=294128 RepID=A0A979FP24_HYAAZ|nr:uncharacterized protein LOC108675664 [Hyalella azteca]
MELQGEGLAASLEQKLGELTGAVTRAVGAMERSGVGQPAHTVAGQLEQAQRWLANPAMDDRGLGQQAIDLIVEEGRKDPKALRGGVGEKSLRQMLELARRVADRALPPDGDVIRKLASDISSMADALCELRQEGKGATPQGEGLAASLEQKLGELTGAVTRAVGAMERSGVGQPAHTVAGQLEQAQRWLANPAMDDRGLGQQAIDLIVEEGRKQCTAPSDGFFHPDLGDDLPSPYWLDPSGRPSSVAPIISPSQLALVTYPCNLNGSVPSCDAFARFQRINGSCNNLSKPRQGMAGSIQQRLFQQPTDPTLMRRFSVTGRLLPNPRTVSEATKNSHVRSTHSDINLFFVFLGQFIDHDFVITPFVEDPQNPGKTLRCPIIVK